MWSWFAAVAWWRREGVECRGARRRVTSRATGTPMTTSTRVSSRRRRSSLTIAGRCWSQKAWCPAAALTYPLPLLDRGVMSSDNKLPPAMLQQNCFTTITGVDFQQWKQPNFFLKTTFPLFLCEQQDRGSPAPTFFLVELPLNKRMNDECMCTYLWQSGIPGRCKSVNLCRISGTNTSQVWYERT